MEERLSKLASARAALEEGRLEDADEIARSILRRNLEATEAWLIVSKIQEALGNRKRAANLYCKLSAVSQDGHYYEIAAELYMKTGLQRDVLFCLREAISLYELQGFTDSACRVRERLQVLEARFNEVDPHH